jgi:hypothetical protein
MGDGAWTWLDPVPRRQYLTRLRYYYLRMFNILIFSAAYAKKTQIFDDIILMLRTVLLPF